MTDKERRDRIAVDEVVRQRLRDYDEAAARRNRKRLAEKIAEEFPRAADEVSEEFIPLTRDAGWVKRNPYDPDEYWHSPVYDVSVRRHRKDPVFGSKGGMVQLGISSADGTARHDWRDMQAIKNQLAGAECEGFELFPAESRLLDPSNYYTLWCFPGLNRLNVGANEARRVWDTGEAMAPQRALARQVCGLPAEVTE
jgi:hypothetical protein